MGKIFVPHELRTIEIDVQKKVFRVNGEDFGKGCTGFVLDFRGDEGFDSRMKVDTTVNFVSVRDGQVLESGTNEISGPSMN